MKDTLAQRVDPVRMLMNVRPIKAKDHARTPVKTTMVDTSAGALFQDTSSVHKTH